MAVVSWRMLIENAFLDRSLIWSTVTKRKYERCNVIRVDPNKLQLNFFSLRNSSVKYFETL